MVKHEIKVEVSNSEALKKIIEKVYFEKGTLGKISNRDEFLAIEKSDDVNYTIFKGLNNATVKVTNDEIIDGSMRFMVKEEGEDISLYPISIYCIKEEAKYIFY